MSKPNTSALSHLFQSALRIGFRQAYPRVEVNPEKYLLNVRRMYGLPIESWKDVHRLDERVIEPVSARIIHSSARMAALEGLGFGLGGFATVVPDMGVLAALTLRMLQKLSLVHGFEYSTAEEMGALWLAIATAAGVDLARDYLEKQAIERIAPRDRCNGREAWRGSGRKMGGTGDSAGQWGSCGNHQLLFCAELGTSRAKAFP